MARITVVDCTSKVPNRFELIVLAVSRAQDIIAGSIASVNRDNKEIVLALREIAEGKVDVEKLRQSVVDKYRVGFASKQKERHSNFVYSNEFDENVFSTEERRQVSKDVEPDFDFGMFSDQNIEVND